MSVTPAKRSATEGTAARSTRLSLSEKFTRLRVRLRNPEWRKYGGTLLAGKVMGVGIVLLLMAVFTGLFFTHVYAQAPAAAPPEVKAG
jgi:Amt family ammonium transporter